MSDNSDLQIYAQAKDLPETWDLTTGANFFLHQGSLSVIEQSNPCKQRYLFINSDNTAAIVSYVHKLDIFTYSSLSFKMDITITGVPCSVSDPGLSTTDDSRVFTFLKKQKGAQLILNVNEKLELDGFIRGTTLPACEIDIHWTSFEAYLAALRSHYRYRFKKARKKFKDVEVMHLSSPAEFDENLHQLYLNVFQKSKAKLEQLSLDFFQKFPAQITVFKKEKKPLGFVQYIIHDSQCIFMFGGMDYVQNKKHDTYLNMLLYLVEVAINNGCTSINLGQTAEGVKQKLGCTLRPKYMYVRHSNPIIHTLFKLFIGMLSYKVPSEVYKVFNTPGGQA
ncbi:MAG: GNAT family N-acetyltransferase [Fibrobacteria bacterium]|nr:GNAT family N-acetyltransferase [Fibrobacteria bacterium]